MTCTFSKLPGGFVVACTRGQRAKPCRFCGAPATKLCDEPLRGAKAGKTCDAPMCDRCATALDANVDVCPPHARALKNASEAMVARHEARTWLRNLQREEDAAAQSTSSKVAHVLAAGQTRGHGCHWPGCGAQVPPAMWGCRAHWFTLPREIRDEIWRTYRAGQEDTLSPSDAYLGAAQRAQDWIAEHEAKLTAKSSGKWERAVQKVHSRDRGPGV